MKKGITLFLLSLLFITPGCKQSKETIVNEYNIVPMVSFDCLHPGVMKTVKRNHRERIQYRSVAKPNDSPTGTVRNK